MLNAIHFITRHFINGTATVGVALFSDALFDLDFLPVLSVSVTTYLLSNLLIKNIQIHRITNQTGLTYAEYKHISDQLKQADQQLSLLTKQYLSVRSIRSFKQINEMTSLARSILKIVKQQPRKFYQVEPFFYAHLESATTLTQKYAMLTKQPLKDKEIQLALQDTNTALQQLIETFQTDLKDALSDDIEHLKIELEFAKQSNEQKKKQIEWQDDDK